MDRQLVWAGQIPLETDILNTNKNVHFALGQFAQDVLGTSTIFTGLGCVPNTPAAMNVIVQPGAVYAQAALDVTAYSSLAADSTVTQKQGILKTAQTFNTPAPVTSGQSIVYLISASFLEADANAVVLPYYNAANPSQAYSGPSGTGAPQNTTRQDTVALTLTTGVPATTGNQLTPATPNGQIALYTVTVAYGATSVTAANIAKVSGAPFLSSGSVLAQIGNFKSFNTIGTATTLTGAQSGSYFQLGGGSSYTVTLPAPAAGLRFTFYVSSVTVTISAPSGLIFNALNTSSSITASPGMSYDMVCDGGNWIVLSGQGTAVLSASGYQKLPSGLIIQWGQVGVIAASSSLTVTFPIAYPNAAISTVVSAGATGSGSPVINGVNSGGGGNPKTSFAAWNSSSSIGTQPGYYVSFGY